MTMVTLEGQFQRQGEIPVSGSVSVSGRSTWRIAFLYRVSDLIFTWNWVLSLWKSFSI